MARPQFRPTPEQRKQVRALAAYGTPQEGIAKMVGLRSPKTLRRHFRRELDLGAIEADAAVAQSVFKRAIAGNDTRAALAWLYHRLWRRNPATEKRSGALPDFVVMPEPVADTKTT